LDFQIKLQFGNSGGSKRVNYEAYLFHVLVQSLFVLAGDHPDSFIFRLLKLYCNLNTLTVKNFD